MCSSSLEADHRMGTRHLSCWKKESPGKVILIICTGNQADLNSKSAPEHVMHPAVMAMTGLVKSPLFIRMGSATDISTRMKIQHSIYMRWVFSYDYKFLPILFLTGSFFKKTYPQISPIDGVMDEHFIVWMRIAALPKFRKLYGWINQPISEGTRITFEIENNWEVGGFEGRKSLVLSTNNAFGGKNDWLGPFFYWVGFFCLASAAFFALKQTFRPRVIGDKRYLQYKED